jgi:hypothetical protein
MPTTVVGFRLGNGMYQMTAIVTQTGRLHLASGAYGLPGHTSKPKMPIGEYPVHVRVGDLRDLWGKYQGRGYEEVIVPPACVCLEVTEAPLVERAGTIPRQEAPFPELVAEFVGAAPARPTSRGDLEDAIYDFYTAIGAPARHRGRVPAAAARNAPAPAWTPRAAELLRLLRRGTHVSGPPRRVIGYSVTPNGVRLRAGQAGVVLERDEVSELHAALTAWLLLNPPANGATPSEARDIGSGRTTPP